MQHNFQLHINRGVQPCFLFVFDPNLVLINRNVIWLNNDILFIVFSVCLIPVLNCCWGSAYAKPLAEIVAVNQ